MKKQLLIVPFLVSLVLGNNVNANCKSGSCTLNQTKQKQINQKRSVSNNHSKRYARSNTRKQYIRPNSQAAYAAYYAYRYKRLTPKSIECPCAVNQAKNKCFVSAIQSKYLNLR